VQDGSNPVAARAQYVSGKKEAGRMKKIKHVSAALLLLAVSTTTLQASTIFQVGNDSCEKVSASGASIAAGGPYEAWLAGYLSAVATSDLLPDWETTFSFVLKYCDAHPGEKFHDAVWALVPIMAEAITATIKNRPASPAGDTAENKWRVVRDGPYEANVKYRGRVPLAKFDCKHMLNSSFIESVCYDGAKSYMLIKLSGTWYHYCNIGMSTVANLLEAPSLGRYFNASIKGRFDCRTAIVPTY
jgi:hypothetical protein